MLSGQYQETTQKYEALLKEAENQYKAFENTQNSNRIVLKEQFLIDKEKIAGGYKKLIENLRKQQDQERQAAKENLEHKNNLLQELKIRKAGLRHKRLYEAEIENLKSERYTYSAEKDKATNQILHLKEVIETIQKQWETDDKRIQEDFSRSKEKVNEHIARLEAELNEINYKIESSKNSFYSWLNEHMPGWENTIGKVCDEQLLFQDELSPELVSLTESNFYGVKLNLYEINRTVKTVADYEQEKTALTSRIKELQKTITHLQETRHSDGDKLRSKYQPKIIEHKNTIHESTYAIEQYQVKYEETTVRLDDYNRKAETEKQAQLQTVDSQITETAEAAIIAEGTVKRLEDALKRQIKAKETERSNRIETEEETLKTRLSRINAELGKEQAAFDLKKEALLAQLKNELSQQGAEIKRLGEIETLLVTVEEELNYIETNSSKVILYQADKEELFDKIDSFKSQKQLCQRQLQQEEQKHFQKKQELIAAIKSITESITLIEKELQQTKDDFDAFNNFQTTETYKQAVHLIRETDTKDKTEKRCTALIDELQKNYFNGIERLRELEKTVNSFLGNFQSENIFMFSTQLNSEQEYLRFTSELAEFMQENKIAEYAKRVNERYANIITLIGKETSDLISREGKIAKVISDINKDFIERNFAGVIKNIELRLDKSANKVVQLLVEIKKFNDENAHTLGAANLFTDSNQELNNQKATDLLRQLVKAIKEFKSDTLSLSHSFELQFRIVENDNDTGWVEKLANVGSDGTDVLVKAMINIMLLNVFKEGASRRFKDFKLHCMMDEIGKLHPNNVRGILKFANDRNILLINSSPTENDALAYRHIYKLHKDSKSVTVIKRLITQYTPS